MLTKEKFKQMIKKSIEITGDWKPNWNDDGQDKYFIEYNSEDNYIDINYYYETTSGWIYFESDNKAKEFLDSFPKEELKEFLTLNQTDLLKFINEFELNNNKLENQQTELIKPNEQGIFPTTLVNMDSGKQEIKPTIFMIPQDNSFSAIKTRYLLSDLFNMSFEELEQLKTKLYLIQEIEVIQDKLNGDKE